MSLVPSQHTWAVGPRPGTAVQARGRAQGWARARAGAPPASQQPCQAGQPCLGGVPMAAEAMGTLWLPRVLTTDRQGNPLPRSDQEEAHGTQILSSGSRTFRLHLVTCHRPAPKRGISGVPPILIRAMTRLLGN